MKNCLIFSPCGLTPKAGILVVGIIFAPNLNLDACLLILSENVISKDIISDDYALKLISYLTSLQVKSKILLNNTCSSKQCISTKDVEVSRFFKRSPNNTWTCVP